VVTNGYPQVSFSDDKASVRGDAAGASLEQFHAATGQPFAFFPWASIHLPIDASGFGG
jgi:hypothetical protein